MLQGVEALGISHRGNPAGVVTISAGVAVLGPLQPRSAHEVLAEANQALYRAKQLGRNRIEQAA